jgi:hypothetical protein
MFGLGFIEILIVIILLLVLVLYVAGFRGLALLLLLVLLGLLAYFWLERRASVQGLPSAPVVLPSDGGLYPDGHDTSGTVLH